MLFKEITGKKYTVFSSFLLYFLIGISQALYAQESFSFQEKSGNIERYIQQHEYQEARNTLLRNEQGFLALKDLENLRWYYNQLAYCNLRLELYDEAKVALDNAIRFQKEHTNNNQLQFFYLNFGDYYLQTGGNDFSLEYFLKFRNAVGENDKENRISLARIYSKLSMVYQAKNETDIAYKYLDSLENILNTKADLPSEIVVDYYRIKGFHFQEQREEEIGISFYLLAMKELEAAKFIDKITMAYVTGRLGESYYFQYNYEKAKKYLKRSSKLYVEQIGGNASGLSSNYSVMARIYSKSGQFKSALEYNEKNLSISTSKHGTQSWQVGLAYAIMGITYGRMDDFASALTYFEKANIKFILNFGLEHRWVVTTYENIGRAHNRLGNYYKSLRNYEKAIALGKKALGPDHVIVAHVYLNAADTYAALKQNDEAIGLYEKALKINIKKYGEKHREVAQNYVGLGDFYQGLKDYKNAIKNYDIVIKMYQSEIDATIKAKMANEEFIVLYKILGALEGKGQSTLSRYLEKNEIEDLIRSKNAYEQADNILEKMRRAVSDYEDKIEIADENQNGPTGAMETNYLLYKERGNSEDIERAFYFSEKNRAAALEQLLAKSNQKIIKGRFRAVVKKDQNLKKQRSTYLSEIKNEENKTDANKRDSVLITRNKNELFKINQQIDSLQLHIKNNYPSYFAISHEKDLISMQEIQQKLDDKTTLVEYFRRDSTTTYAFVITAKKYVVESLRTKDLDQTMQSFKEGVLEKNIIKYRTHAHTLYQQLLEPLSKYFVADELILVPHGDLWQLNFDLLLTEKHNGNNPKLMPYVLRKYVISYANSANTLFQYDKIDPTTDKACLAFSFGDIESDSKNTPVSMETLRNSKVSLPGTSDEINAISNIMDGDYYYGNVATERLFKDKASQYAIVHLALHGEVDNKHPENSKLLFSKERDSMEDNILYSHELFTMEVPAQLVVLSACNSGSGKITSGEGIMSIGNAFQYAGTNSLLMTQWEISDKVAPIIMREFYKNLKNGMRKSRALQQAKLAYIKEADAMRANPFYWGSFYLVGDVNPLFLETSFKWLYYLLGGLAILGGFLFLRKRFWL